MSEKSEHVTVEVDVEVAFKLDQSLRDGLVANGDLTATESKALQRAGTPGKQTATLKLDAKTAALITKLLRDSLIVTQAASSAANDAIGRAVARIRGE
jgi:polyhydroxyalkanoate synthesis regulator phasin